LVPWKTLGYYCTPSYKNISSLNCFGELCTKKNLDFKDVLQSYGVAYIKQCWLECQCGHEEIGICMRKLWHYPKNGLDRKTSNEVTKDDQDFNWILQALHELPCHTILFIKTQ